MLKLHNLGPLWGRSKLCGLSTYLRSLVLGLTENRLYMSIHLECKETHGEWDIGYMKKNLYYSKLRVVCKMYLDLGLTDNRM